MTQKQTRVKIAGRFIPVTSPNCPFISKGDFTNTRVIHESSSSITIFQGRHQGKSYIIKEAIVSPNDIDSCLSLLNEAECYEDCGCFMGSSVVKCYGYFYDKFHDSICLILDKYDYSLESFFQNLHLEIEKLDNISPLGIRVLLLGISRKMAQCLHDIHSIPICHRDIKMSNLFINVNINVILESLLKFDEKLCHIISKNLFQRSSNSDKDKSTLQSHRDDNSELSLNQKEDNGTCESKDGKISCLNLINKDDRSMSNISDSIINRIFPFDIYIGDFGVAKNLSENISPKNIKQIEDYRHQLCSTFVGTPLYLSPELLRVKISSKFHYTISTDIWSLGVCLWEMFESLCQEHLFMDNDFDAVCERIQKYDIPKPKSSFWTPDIHKLILNSLLSTPEKRISNISSINQDLSIIILNEIGIIPDNPNEDVSLASSRSAPAAESIDSNEDRNDEEEEHIVVPSSRNARWERHKKALLD